MSNAVYLAAERGPADDLSDGLTKAANEIEEAREWLKACLQLVEGGGPPNWDGIREFLKN
jgi:hypothetical protein